MQYQYELSLNACEFQLGYFYQGHKMKL